MGPGLVQQDPPTTVISPADPKESAVALVVSLALQQ